MTLVPKTSRKFEDHAETIERHVAMISDLQHMASLALQLEARAILDQTSQCKPLKSRADKHASKQILTTCSAGADVPIVAGGERNIIRRSCGMLAGRIEAASISSSVACSKNSREHAP